MTTDREDNSSARARMVFVGACALGIALLTLAITVAIPRSLVLFKDLGVREFPLPTQVLMSLSDAVARWWFLFVTVLPPIAVLLGLIAARLCPLPSRGWRIGIVGVLIAAIVFALLATALPLMAVVNNLKG